MVSLGKNLKMPKTWKNDSTVTLEKTARKNTRYWRNGTVLKISHVAKGNAHAKPLVFAKWSV